MTRLRRCTGEWMLPMIIPGTWRWMACAAPRRKPTWGNPVCALSSNNCSRMRRPQFACYSDCQHLTPVYLLNRYVAHLLDEYLSPCRARLVACDSPRGDSTTEPIPQMSSNTVDLMGVTKAASFESALSNVYPDDFTRGIEHRRAAGEGNTP